MSTKPQRQQHEFACGCVIDKEVTPDSFHMFFTPNIHEINLECPAVWDMISEGNTKGIFQLESRFGQKLAKQLKPRNIEHLGALSAIMRPGCSDSERDGKTITQHYIDRKNGEEEVNYFHPALKPALEATYGEMIYQEQAMQIAKDVAGFNLQQADILRKAIGKKKPEIMAKVKQEFLDGAVEVGVLTVEEAEEVFGWIEKSQRYSFNKSHSISYAINGYLSAYVKAHFPRAFFTSYLHFSFKKQKPKEEVAELIENAKLMDVEVGLPYLPLANKHFNLHNKKISFGFCDLKDIGDSAATDILYGIRETEKSLDKKCADWTWLETMLFFAPYTDKSSMSALIFSGALDYLKQSRRSMWYQYDKFKDLSTGEKKWILQNSHTATNEDTLADIIQLMLEAPIGRAGGIQRKDRVPKVESILKSLRNPPRSLLDNPVWLSETEITYLGVAISCSRIDECDISAANCTCDEIKKGINYRQRGSLIVAAQVDSVNEYAAKNGKMGFIKLSDISCALDAVVFAEKWPTLKEFFVEGNTLLISGSHSSTEKGSIIINNVYQL